MKKFLILIGIILLSTVGYTQGTCAAAINLTPGTAQCGTNSFAGSFNDAGGNNINPCDSWYNDGEYWFKYVGTGGNLTLNVSALSSTYSGIYVLDGCPAVTPPNCIASYSNGSSTANYNVITPNLALGTTYYIIIANWSAPYSTNFCLNSVAGAPPTIYDMIAGPSTINTCGPGVFRDPGGAANYPQNATTYTQTFCSNSGNAIQFNFTTFATFEVADNLKIYNGPNTGSPLIGTYSVASSPGIVTSSTGCLTFVWTTDNDNKLDVGWVSSIKCVPFPPSNDNPCSATAATVNTDLLCGTVTAGTVNNSTNSGIAACVGSGADDDVWFSFVATSTVHNFDLLNIVGTQTDMVFEIFSGACAGLGSIACSDPNSGQWSGFTIGTTYYVRVYTYGTTSANTTFNLCIGTPPPPPSNDEPCGALVLNVNVGSCSYQSAVLQTSATVSVGMPLPGCGSLGPDIWYKFVVPASGRIIIDMSVSGGPSDMDMAWYTSSTNNCNNLNTLVDCDDLDSQDGMMAMICHAGASCVVPGDCQQLATLTPGQTVYVRLWEYGGTPFGPFDICAYDPGAPGAPSNCGNATVIASLPYSNAGQTTCCRGFDYDVTDGCLSSYQDGEDYMYTYTPAANQTIDVTLTGTLSYTGVFITNKCPNAGGVVCVGSATSSSGNPTLCGVALTGGVTYYIMIDTDPTPNCTPFNINVTSSSTPTCGLNYTFANIAFAPDLNAGTNIALPIDDRFSSSYIPIGFNFCFDGYQFSQLLVSSNGYVIFDPIGCASNLPTGNAAPGAYSAYSINAAIPNTTNAPRNAIMFPWQDIDPSLGGTIKYQVLGVSPNRRFVLTFDQIPYYSCTTKKFTGQLKLFETTNNIEMHIANKEDCSTWNAGAGILGLHNYNGTIAKLGVNYPTTGAYSNIGRRITNNCVGPCVVLPVELLSFDGKSIENYNLIEWKTATEINNDYFILERSDDGQTFEKVDIIKGGGNSNTILNYSYNHYNPKELEYYRLKQVDFDGKFEYSNIIAISSKIKQNISIYPNPSRNNIYIALSESTNGKYTIVYTNVLGSVSKEQIEVTEDINSYQVKEFVNLSQGIYFIQIIDENDKIIKTEKIVKN